MNVKLADIKAQFPNALICKKVNSRQLFIVLFAGYKLLISYRTIIGFKQSGTWYITNKHYSQTTSRQIQFAVDRVLLGDIVRLDQETFEANLELLQGW